MKLLALDQALKKSGFAIFEDKRLIRYGSFSIKPSLPIEQRLVEIQKELTNLLYQFESFDFVVFEDIQQQQNPQTYKRLAYCQATIMLWCYFNEIPFMILSPSEWRAINGGGYGKKREEQKEIAIQKVKQWYKIDVDSDTADAINIGRAAISEKRTKTSAF